MMRRVIWVSAAAVAAITCTAPLAAQVAEPPVQYQLSFANRVHHEARIDVRFDGVPEGPFRVRMSRSSPGRYAIHEFAKNVYDVTATDGAGQALHISRDEPYSWVIDGHDGTVIVRYTLFGDLADGTYSQIDTTHAHLNAPSSLMWAEGFVDRSATVRFVLPHPDWKIATQLFETAEPNVYRAPNFAYLMDSPVEISDHDVREWTVSYGGETANIRLAVHHAGTREEVDKFESQVRDVVAEHIALWQDIPDFDGGHYTFLADYLPHVDGDGMEHRNSTSISSSQGLAQADYAQLGTVSHEFVHSWNVERFRPAEIEPFDFTKADPTPSLWLAEGFTNYYGPLLIHRAGHSTIEKLLASYTGQLNYVQRSSGRHGSSPQEMSLRAPFMDDATAVDPTNFSNVMISYYSYGAVLALALDMELRSRFDDVTLDDFMRALWQRYGKNETPYTQADVEATLAAVTGDAAFAKEIFDTRIRAGELPDYAPLLAKAGILVRLRNPGKATLGRVQISFDDGKAMLSGNTLRGEPIYRVGLDRGDEIVSVGGRAIGSRDDWDALGGAFKPGDHAEIIFIQRGEEKRVTAIFAEDDAIEMVTYEKAEMTPSEEQLAFRAAWLASQRRD